MSTSPASNYKNVILVSDHECATAIMYRFGIRPEGIYKDSDDNFYCSFKQDATILSAIDDYDSGELAINIVGYPQFYDEALLEWDYITNEFEGTGQDGSE